MNRYRVNMTIGVPVAMEVTTPAEDDARARRYARDAAKGQYPDFISISIDRVTELSKRAPTPDPLAQARDIIAGLLDAANHGVTELESLAVDALADEGIEETRTLREDYDRRSQEAWATIEAARAFLASQEAGA